MIVKYEAGPQSHRSESSSAFTNPYLNLEYLPFNCYVAKVGLYFVYVIHKVAHDQRPRGEAGETEILYFWY